MTPVNFPIGGPRKLSSPFSPQTAPRRPAIGGPPRRDIAAAAAAAAAEAFYSSPSGRQIGLESGFSSPLAPPPPPPPPRTRRNAFPFDGR